MIITFFSAVYKKHPQKTREKSSEEKTLQLKVKVIHYLSFFLSVVSIIKILNVFIVNSDSFLAANHIKVSTIDSYAQSCLLLDPVHACRLFGCHFH